MKITRQSRPWLRSRPSHPLFPLFFLLIFAACASANNPPGASAPSHSVRNATIREFTAADTKTPIVAECGERFMIRLPAPDTAGAWVIIQPTGDETLSLLDESHGGGNPRLGAESGEWRWIFQARMPGREEVIFEKSKSRERLRFLVGIK